jgi:hypothetical protein
LQDFLDSPYGFGIFFVVFWCFICFLISLLSGWFSLSKRFRKQSEPYGETRTAGPLFYSVRMRFGNYGNSIRLTAAEDALYASVLFLFRVGHPPLRIPWSEIQFRRRKFLWMRSVVLTLGDRERIAMRISERMARKLGILERIADEVKLPLGSAPIV